MTTVPLFKVSKIVKKFSVQILNLCVVLVKAVQLL